MDRCEMRTAAPPGDGGVLAQTVKMPAAVVSAACALALAVGLLAPAGASAGSGVFCSSCVLSVGSRAIGNFRGHFYETETWNSDGKGVGSCSGVGNSSGSYANVACHGDATGYNEVYCTGCNGYTNWWAIMSNNSNHGYTSVFTGWEWYA